MELGPKSMALLRRAVIALEILADVESNAPADPGPSFTDGQRWYEPGDGVTESE